MARERKQGAVPLNLESPTSYLDLDRRQHEAQKSATQRIRGVAERLGGPLSDYTWPLMFDAEGTTQFTHKKGMSSFATRFLHVGLSLVQHDIPQSVTTRDSRGGKEPITGINVRRFNAIMDYMAASAVAYAVDERIKNIDDTTRKAPVHAAITSATEVVTVPPSIFKEVRDKGLRPGSREFSERIRARMAEQASQPGVQDEDKITSATVGSIDTKEYKDLKSQAERLATGITTLVDDQGLNDILPDLLALQKVMQMNLSVNRFRELRQIDFSNLRQFLVNPDKGIVIGNISPDMLAAIASVADQRGIGMVEPAQTPTLSSVTTTGLPESVSGRLKAPDIGAVYLVEDESEDTTATVPEIVATVATALGSKQIPIVSFAEHTHGTEEKPYVSVSISEHTESKAA